MKNLQASQAFYEKLGFERVLGDPAQNWLILRNGTVTIGLFQGMFERNVLTFNPGWDDHARAVERIYRRPRASTPPEIERAQAHQRS